MVKEEDAVSKGIDQDHSEGEIADGIGGAGPMEKITPQLKMPLTWREGLGTSSLSLLLLSNLPAKLSEAS